MFAKVKKYVIGLLVFGMLLGGMPIPMYADEVDNGTDSGNDDVTTENPDADTSQEEEKQWVVVLDPGHGGADGGASRTINGVEYVERDLVLKIAYYCKEELEKYDNIMVYMTRTDNTNMNWDRQQRAYYAATVGADVLVSFHLNATNATTTYGSSGAEVYYPNGNYAVDISDASWYMSDSILTELSKLGITNNGAKVRNTEDGSTYPDGSKADYLGINYWSKYYGFSGILIEHAYINNPNDVYWFLSTEESLRQIGIADAQGIVDSLNSGNFVYEKGVAGVWNWGVNGWWFDYATGGYAQNTWEYIYGHWYWFDEYGYMATGWQYIDGEWYYFGGADDGVMKTGWQYINNQWYYFTPSGNMLYGWQYIGNNWYYLGLSYDGAMKTGWQYIDNEWYYLGAYWDGAMKTGWQYVNGNWYYMYGSGVMAYSTWIGGYYVNEAGVWIY